MTGKPPPPPLNALIARTFLSASSYVLASTQAWGQSKFDPRLTPNPWIFLRAAASARADAMVVAGDLRLAVRAWKEADALEAQAAAWDREARAARDIGPDLDGLTADELRDIRELITERIERTEGGSK